MASRYLYITLPSGRAHTVELDGVVVIGRDRQNDIVLDDASISRYHAMLLVEAHGVVLFDLESTNGTLVNGKLVLPEAPVALEDGTQIALGPVLARYHE